MAHVTLEERSTEHSELHHGGDGEAILGKVRLRLEWITTILSLHVVLRNVQRTGVVRYFAEAINRSGLKPEHGASGVCLLHFCFATKQFGIPSTFEPSNICNVISLYGTSMSGIVRSNCI